MSENYPVIDGRKYRSVVPADGSITCSGCVAHARRSEKWKAVCNQLPCAADQRTDNQDVIFAKVRA